MTNNGDSVFTHSIEYITETIVKVVPYDIIITELSEFDLTDVCYWFEHKSMFSAATKSAWITPVTTRTEKCLDDFMGSSIIRVRCSVELVEIDWLLAQFQLEEDITLHSTIIRRINDLISTRVRLRPVMSDFLLYQTA